MHNIYNVQSSALLLGKGDKNALFSKGKGACLFLIKSEMWGVSLGKRRAGVLLIKASPRPLCIPEKKRCPI